MSRKLSPEGGGPENRGFLGAMHALAQIAKLSDEHLSNQARGVERLMSVMQQISCTDDPVLRAVSNELAIHDPSGSGPTR